VTTLYESVLADSGLHLLSTLCCRCWMELRISPRRELADAIGIDQTTATRTLALIKKSRLVANAPGDDRRERHGP